MLDERPEITLPLDEFLAEWRPVLERVIGAMDASGLGFTDPDVAGRLRAVVSALPARHSGA